MRHKHCMTWNMARNTEKREKSEIYTLGPGIWRENCKTRNLRNTQSRTLSMSRKPTNEENEKIMVGPGIWRETWKNL